MEEYKCDECGKEGLIEEWGFEDPKDDTCEGCKKIRAIRRSRRLVTNLKN